jgi:Immunoglobulin-like domain of bacterial spore germination
MRANVKLDLKTVLRIELVGEDGRLLMREVRSYNLDKPQTLTLGTKVGFELPGVAENGRLQIILEDSKGRTASVNSVDLLLLALGDSDINDVTDTFEDIVIQAPRSKALVQGGSVRVGGLARMHSNQPLLIELETGDGKIVGTRQVMVTPIPGSTHGSFEIDIPYQVSSAVQVRVKVWEPSEKIPGILHLSSVEVLLSP